MGDSKDFILSKLPEKSQVQETGNPGNTLIEYVAKEWDQIYLDIVDNGRLRYLNHATGGYLNKFGDWLGIKRPNILIDNLVHVNVTNGGETGIGVTGFGATVTSSTDWCKSGTKSWKVVTNNSATNEGTHFASGYRTTATVGKYYSGRAVVKGVSGQINAILAFRDSNYNTIQSTNVPYTLNGDEIIVECLNKLAPANTAYVSFDIRTTTKQGITFYVDEWIIIEGASISSGVTIDTSTGDLIDPYSDEEYRELILGLMGGAVNIVGLRNLISRVLNIESNIITIQNGTDNCFILGVTDLTEEDTTNNLLQLSTVDYNVIRVTAPEDTYDLTTLRDLIYKSILAGVMVYFNEELL